MLVSALRLLPPVAAVLLSTVGCGDCPALVDVPIRDPDGVYDEDRIALVRGAL
jgi:hypothetical protein